MTNIITNENRTTNWLIKLVDLLCAPSVFRKDSHRFAKYIDCEKLLGMECPILVLYESLRLSPGDLKIVTKRDSKRIEILFDFDEEITDHIFQAMRSMLEILLDNDDNFCEKVSIRQYFSFYRNSCHMSSAEFFKHMKYLTYFPLALYMHNEFLPSTLENPWIFSGRVRRYLLRRTVGTSNKCRTLWWSWLQGVKRGCSPADTEIVDLSYEKHRTSIQNIPIQHSEEYLQDFQHKVKLLTKGFNYKMEILQHSNAASFENPRTEGGSIVKLIRDFNGIKFPLPLSCGKVMLRMFEGNKGVETIYGYVSYNYFDELWNEIFEDEDFHRRVKCSVYAVKEPLKIRMITKGETRRYALVKCFQKALWRHLQRFSPFCLTGEILDKSHIYSLIEQTNSLENLFFDTKPFIFDQFVSADYSQATDLIDANLSNIVMEGFVDQIVKDMIKNHPNRSLEDLIQDLNTTRRRLLDYELNTLYDKDVWSPTEWELWQNLSRDVVNLQERISQYKTDVTEFVCLKDCILSVLAPHDVWYPDTKEFVTQTNGQLMGSPLSFPILNIINLIAYWRSIEQYLGTTVDLKDLPVFINGDDCLFKSNDDHYDIWKREVKEVGFELSVGKNYIHDSLLTVNSKLFDVKQIERKHLQPTIVVEEVYYFNVGLLLGKQKVQDDKNSSSGVTSAKRLSDNYEKVMLGAQNKVRAHHRFIKYNMKKLPNYGVNWFISEHLGGLGFRLFDEVKELIKVTDYQKCLATYCLEHLESPTKYVMEGIDRWSKKKSCAPRVCNPLYGPYLEEHIPLRDTSINIQNGVVVDLDQEGPVIKLLFKYLKRKSLTDCRPFKGDLFKKSVYMESKLPWNHEVNIPSITVTCY